MDRAFRCLSLFLVGMVCMVCMVCVVCMVCIARMTCDHARGKLQPVKASPSSPFIETNGSHEEAYQVVVHPM